MDDFFLLIEALVNGVDWQVFVQIPHSKHSKTICEALAYGGLWPLFSGKCKGIELQEVARMDPRRFFGIAVIHGLEVTDPITGQKSRINDVEIVVQLPRFKQVEASEVFKEMVSQGLGYYLGATVKRVRVKPAGETIPEALENEKVILA